MSLSVTSIASASNQPLTFVTSTVATASLTLTGGASPGDLLLFMGTGNSPNAVTDTHGNTYQISTGAAAVMYCRVSSSLSAGDVLTLFYAPASAFPNPVTAENSPGVLLLKVTGGDLSASSALSTYYDVNDADAGGTTYEPATAARVGSGTSVTAYSFINDNPAPTTRDEITLVWMDLRGRDPASPLPPFLSNVPFTDTPASPTASTGSFTGFGVVDGKWNSGVDWQQTKLYSWAYPNIPDNTTVTTDALNFAGSTYGWNLQWLSLVLAQPVTTGLPWNLETRGGQYHIVYGDTGSIKYQRSDSTRPPLGTAATVSGGGSDERPRVWEEGQPAGRVRLLWRRSGAVVTAHSDDDGDTWSTPVTLWTSGSTPGWATGNSDPLTGITLFLARVGSTIQVRRQEPGDSSPGTAFTPTGLPSVDDASFHVWPAQDTARRWLLVLLSGGAVTSYASTDDGDTWYSA